MNAQPISPDTLLSAGNAQLMKYSYIAVAVDAAAIEPLNQELEAILGDDFAELKANRDDRDGLSNYHMTLVGPRDYRQMKKALKVEGQQLTIPTEPFEFEILGIGSAANDVSRAWFAVCLSEAADAWRTAQGLGTADLHVTLAFEAGGDVHGVSKGVNSLL